jgi:hypothetical protein
MNAANFFLPTEFDEGLTCESGLDSFVVRLPDGRVVVASQAAALTTCLESGFSGTFLKYYGGPDTDLAAFCFDYTDKVARAWTSYFGCCEAGTTPDD